MSKGFTAAQTIQLLHPINPKRVLSDGKKHAHVSQQDILAHLIRVFGFGNFDIDIKDVSLVFEKERVNEKGELLNRFDVCYKALVRLTIRDPQGNEICHYENGSTATAQNQTLGDAHDLAYKSCISLSVKRAAIALGDQFGLSLYNKGQMTALVMDTLIRADGATVGEKDMQEGVEQQVSLGNDEVDKSEDEEPGVKPKLDNTPPASRTYSDEMIALATDAMNVIGSYDDLDLLKTFYDSKEELWNVPVGKTTFQIEVTKRVKALKANVPPVK